MQIDTHNRNYALTDEVGYRRWVLPAQVTNATQTEIDADAGWSPLLECPCTDRISRITTKTSRLLIDRSTCASERVASEAACVAAIAPLARVVSSSTTHDPRRPAGCLALPASQPGTAIALYNADGSSTATCAPPARQPRAALPLHGLAALAVGGAAVDLRLSHDGNRSASIWLSGPAGSWFGVGFGASSMADMPYALIVDGSGGVSERKVRASRLLLPRLSPPLAAPLPFSPRHIRSTPLSRRHLQAHGSYDPLPPPPACTVCVHCVRALCRSWPTTGRAES